jgi:VCBS repeat-containing protein
MALDDGQGSGRQAPDFARTGGRDSGLTYAVLKQPVLGWVTNNGDGTFSFDPGTDFRGLGTEETRQVSFDYQASDGWGGTETARAIVTVTGAADGTLAIEVSYGGRLEDDGPGSAQAVAGDATGSDANSRVSAPPVAGPLEIDTARGKASDSPAPTGTDMDPRHASGAAADPGQAGNTSAAPAAEAKPPYAIVAQPSEGRVTPNADGTFDFLPAAGFPDLAIGELHRVTFTCRSNDEGPDGHSIVATLTIAGTSDGPVAGDVSFRRAREVATPRRAAAAEVETGRTAPGPEPIATGPAAAADLRERPEPDGEPDDAALADDTTDASAELTDFTLSNDTVLENCEPGTLVGQVVMRGTGETSGFIYDLQRDAGGRFDINPRTGRITVAEGSRLNHATEASHDILIQVIDSGGMSWRKTCTIKVLPADTRRTVRRDAVPDPGPETNPAPEVRIEGSEAPRATLPGTEDRKDPPAGTGAAASFGQVGGVQEKSGNRRHDTLGLDGVTGGPGTGGWTLALSEGVIVARDEDHILLSANSAGVIGFDGTAFKVSFRGVERIEW